MNVRAIADPPARSSLRDRLEKNVADLNRMRNELDALRKQVDVLRERHLMLRYALLTVAGNADCALVLESGVHTVGLHRTRGIALEALKADGGQA